VYYENTGSPETIIMISIEINSAPVYSMHSRKKNILKISIY